jgi:hypothetical protein
MGFFLTTNAAVRNRPTAHPAVAPKPLPRFRRLSVSGLRYYSPEMGRWINRDPIGDKLARKMSCLPSPVSVISTCSAKAKDDSEPLFLYWFIRNNPPNQFDILGLRVGGTIECQGGKPVVVIVVGPNDVPGGQSTVDCFRRHEQQHLADINRVDPDYCEGKPDGTKWQPGDWKEYHQTECNAYYSGNQCLRDIDPCQLKDDREREQFKRLRMQQECRQSCHCAGANAGEHTDCSYCEAR